MANMNFKANILPATSQGYNLGSSTQQWVIYGPIHSNGIYGTENVDYGATLPASATEGQIFFQTSNTVVYSVPSGGQTGYALVKSSNADGDFSWQEIVLEVPPGNAEVFAGTIPTSASSGAKALVCPDFTSTELVVGAIVYGTISATNTATPSALTLNVNSTGAKPIKYIQNGELANLPAAGYLAANQTYQFHYDGTNWVVDNIHYDTDTTYSVLSAASGGTSASLVTTGEKYTWNNMGTVKSVQVSATSPVVSSNSATQSNSLSTTISLANNYGDTKNPYAAKPTRYVLAGPVYDDNTDVQVDAAPTFRALVASDIPTIDIVNSTTNTLPIDRGGTGATTTATAWTNLGGGDIGKLNKGNASATATFLAENGTWLTPPGTYTLPKATSSILGGVTVGDGLSVDNGNVSVNWGEAPVASVNGATGTVVLSDLVIGSSHYNGSTTVTVSITDLGLSSPMTFKGVTDTAIVDGANVTPVNITAGGIIGSLTPSNGDVVLQKDEQIEYLYTVPATGTPSWVQLGLASSYSLAEHSHGHILNDGTMSTTASVANGDHLLIADVSDYNRIISADELTFDTSAPYSALSRAGTWVDYLQLSGGTMTGAVKTKGWIGTLDYDYGEILPTTATEGQIFFQVSYGDEVEFKIPAGGTAGYALVKNSNADGDLKWQLIQANDKVAKAGDTMTGNLIVTSAATGSMRVEANNTNGRVGIYASTNRGLYDFTGSKWIIYLQASDNTVRTQYPLYGAVWNDYAEFRKDNPEERGLQMPGTCVREVGDGKLVRTTSRLERGCEIISDTFGFSIGQDKANGINTPIASSGRVLAYIYEGREKARNHIGWPVCSGPNGTVSIMTEEEEIQYPSRIIGTISEIPDYETWGDGNVIVNDRIWIRIK